MYQRDHISNLYVESSPKSCVTLKLFWYEDVTYWMVVSQNSVYKIFSPIYRNGNDEETFLLYTIQNIDTNMSSFHINDIIISTIAFLW